VTIDRLLIGFANVYCMLHAMKCSHGAIYCALRAKQSTKRAIVLPSQNVCAKPGKKLHDYSHDAQNCMQNIACNFEAPSEVALLYTIKTLAV
jgi:hypothetical protein